MTKRSASTAMREGLVSSHERKTSSASEQVAAAQFAVDAHRHGRTALVALGGELDLSTV